MRISRHQMYMEMARIASQRSTCMRLNVGCVIADHDRILSIGYNGAPSGMPHCSGNECPGKQMCLETVHAETNALARLPEAYKKPLIGLDMYVTHSPCGKCFKEIVSSGFIGRLFFETPYRLADHLKDTHFMEVFRTQPAGYVVKWPSQELIDE